MKQDLFNGNNFFKSNILSDEGLLIKGRKPMPIGTVSGKYIKTNKGWIPNEKKNENNNDDDDNSTDELIGKVILQGQDAEEERWKKLEKEAKEKPSLKKDDINNIHDVDIYRIQNPDKEGSIDSRYNTLLKLFGANQANKMMRELEVASWKH